MLARGLDRKRVGIGIPSRRMDHRGRYARFVHLLERVVRAVVGNLTMVRVRLAAFPDVDLCVDDQHALLPAYCSVRVRGGCPGCRACAAGPVAAAASVMTTPPRHEAAFQ